MRREHQHVYDMMIFTFFIRKIKPKRDYTDCVNNNYTIEYFMLRKKKYKLCQTYVNERKTHLAFQMHFNPNHSLRYLQYLFGNLTRFPMIPNSEIWSDTFGITTFTLQSLYFLLFSIYFMYLLFYGVTYYYNGGIGPTHWPLFTILSGTTSDSSNHHMILAKMHLKADKNECPFQCLFFFTEPSLFF